MQFQPQNIINEDWDYLIILDACRYDFFEKCYKDYLEGKLEKRRSRGAHTAEWLVNTFPKKSDITYLSANPYINSAGIPLYELDETLSYKWSATEHFNKVIDIWASEWNETLNTVPPTCLNRKFFTINPPKRTIVHYMQPHTPYLSLNSFSSRSSLQDLRNRPLSKGNNNKRGKKNKSLYSLLRSNITSKIDETLNTETIWRIRNLLGLPATREMEYAWREKGIAHYYEDNLKRVLKAVANLVVRTEGKIIVTSDHGEALGEHGIFSHYGGAHIPVLIEVPWLEINN